MATSCCSPATAWRATATSSPCSSAPRSAGPAFDAPSAVALLELAAGKVVREEFVGPDEVLPLYLRQSDAEINWERV